MRPDSATSNPAIASTAPPRFVFLDNYITLFTTDGRFKNAILITFYFTILGVTVQTFLGVTLALLFNRQFWGRGILRTLAILPMVATPVAIALIFVLMFHPLLGVMNYFLSVVGLPPWSWTYASSTVIPAGMLGVWKVRVIPARATRSGANRSMRRAPSATVPASGL